MRDSRTPIITGEDLPGYISQDIATVGKDVQQKFIRGYAFAAGGARRGGDILSEMIGAELKSAASKPGEWGFWMTGMGECLPYFENKISLSKDKKDAWDMPLLQIDCEYKANEVSMLDGLLSSGAEMLEKAGFKNITTSDTGQAPGLGIHEMGTARMGRDPKTSVLNQHNQVWAAKNIFVTDGSCMTSNACQNPSITYMALTARAADYAVSELKKQNL